MADFCLNFIQLFPPDRSPAFWLGRLAFVPDGWSKPRADSGPNRPPASGGRAAFQIRLHALYSTRPHGLVQAISWHTCPDLDLGPWYGLTHLIHIALSGSMTSRVRVSARSRPPPPFIPTLIGLRAFDLVSSPVWWEAVTNIIQLFPPLYLWRGFLAGFLAWLTGLSRSMIDSKPNDSGFGPASFGWKVWTGI